MRKSEDLVHTITRPVSVERPALDFLVNASCDGTARLYHLRFQDKMFREALEVTYFLFKDKIKYWFGEARLRGKHDITRER